MCIGGFYRSSYLSLQLGSDGQGHVAGGGSVYQKIPERLGGSGV